MEAITQFFTNQSGDLTALSIYFGILRIAIPVMALAVVLRCAISLLSFRREPEIWAWLRQENGELIPVTHWENVLGRKKTADIVLDFATVSKNHAVLTRHDNGSWTIREIGDHGRLEIDGQQVLSSRVEYGSTISLGGYPLVFEPLSREEADLQSRGRTKAGKGHSPGLTLVLLTILQAMMVMSLCLTLSDRAGQIVLAFGELILLEWLLFAGQKLIRRSGFEIEAIAFFLMSIGLCVIASSAPGELQKTILIACAGIVLFLLVGLTLRSLRTAQTARYVAFGAGILLLIVNLAFMFINKRAGRDVNGAYNWIFIGGFSFQPSELLKVCFVFFGASTMERLVTKRNLIGFIVYAAFICVCLAIMHDFGTALVFFVCYFVISYLRSGNYAAMVLMIAFLAVLLLVPLVEFLSARFFPQLGDRLAYIGRRFAGWGHIWEHPYDSLGYQQTHALMCVASGGVFGLGLGNGFLKYVAAGDTDLVFAMVAEEGGLLLALLAILGLGVLGMFVVRSARVARSSFYTISACAAVSILATQAILNVFGTVDFLPLTGVTFPFVSHGGSSLLASWGLLAFIKACDTRQNASFAVKLSVRKKDRLPEVSA